MRVVRYVALRLGVALVTLIGVSIIVFAAIRCPFSARCPWAIDRCFADKPVLREVDGSYSACHRAEEVGAA